MKKTIMFLGVLSLGLAHAQQDFDGKVGVNTETPSATLDIKAFKSDGATTKRIIGTAISYDPTKIETGIKEMYGLKISNIDRATDLLNGYTKNYAIYTGTGKIRLGDNVMIKTDVEAPKSILTVNGIAAFGDNNSFHHRAIFTGSTGGNLLPGTFVGFGAYPNNTEAKFKTSKENHSTLGRNRFFMFNDIIYGRFFFTPFIAADGKVEEEFNLVNESAMTIIHEGKKVGIGTNSPSNRLHIKADADPLKLEGLQETTDANAKNLVVVDGVVKVGSANSTGATQLSGTEGIQCNEENRGKMNFKKAEDGKSDVFGVCLKHKNGDYNWAYLVGGNHLFEGTGTFGDGL